jgi:carboxypeptidase Q
MDGYRDVAARIIKEATADASAWRRLAELTDTFGHRLSGSPQLELAIAWAAAQMKKDGLENVRTEPVMVPHWVRGQESLELVEPSRQPLVMLGLGGSVGTPPEGIEAPAVVVRSFADADAKGEWLRGKIVVYNAPFTNYGETVQYRSNGASHAARYGAAAVLVRAVGPPGLRTAHTGGMRYAPNAPQIPAASISVEDAERLQRLQDREVPIVLRLRMGARTLPDAESANVIAELRGHERPDEIVVVGGHIDSWDVGTGAMDDGGGCIVTWEAVRLLKRLNLRPRRTIRVVLWTNEENGLRGAVAYRDRHT